MLEAAWFMLMVFASEPSQGIFSGFSETSRTFTSKKNYATKQDCESDIPNVLNTKITPEAKQYKIGFMCVSGFVTEGK